jgi:hypothetical protein
MRGLAREQGLKFASCSVENFVRNVRKTAPQSALSLLEPLLQTLEVIEPQIGRVEEELGALCNQEPVVAQLCTTPGVGAIVAA